MELHASDIVALYRPSLCENRLLRRERGEPESEPSAFDEVLHRLGIRHEREHLSTLGPHLDLSSAAFPERFHRTAEAIFNREPVLYQPAFQVTVVLDGLQTVIVGVPDFLIWSNDGYLIRDSKLSRHIDQENHPEILLQVQAYAWLYEQSTHTAAKSLQVHSGTNDIVEVPYDGGIAALTELKRVLAIKRRTGQPYEPVGWSKCTGCGFGEPCLDRAEQEHDVALLVGVDQNLAKTLHARGVHTWQELLATFDVQSLSDLKRPWGAGTQRVGKKAEGILRSAKAMENRQERVIAAPALPQAANYVMFDLEGMPPHLTELDKIYLWGMQVYGKNPNGFMPAVAGFGPDGDREGWLAFLETARQVFGQYGDVPFVHWAPYEKTYLSKYIDRYGDVNGTAARVKANLLDLLPVTQASVVLPLPSYSLKVVEEYVGYKRTQTEYGGDWAMAMFIEATETSDEGRRQQLMTEILQYNKEDLEATWAVFEWLKMKTPLANRA